MAKRSKAESDRLKSAKEKYIALFGSLEPEDRKVFCAYIESKSALLLEEGGADDRKQILVGAKGGRNKFWADVTDRFSLLATLMVFQSLSSFILSSFQEFIESHIFVTLYLTMLVGAGGNAGNQSAVMVIRGMALGEITDFSICKTEAMKAGIIGVMMFFAGYVRVYLFQQEVLPSLAVACAQFMIVVTSIVTGAMLPLVLERCHLDPAHAGPIIQVIMDVTGVFITCKVCSFMIKADIVAPHSISV